MAKTIRIIKRNGEVQYKQNLLYDLENAFNTIVNGEYVLTISKAVKKRTIDQNRLMWMWFTCIERETGTEKNDVHDYYCMLFLGRTAMINREEKKIIGGTSKLNTEQFTDFMNKVQADAAAEFGIRLPTPEDLYFESFKEEYKGYMI
jgi:hypothetical protein